MTKTMIAGFGERQIASTAAPVRCAAAVEDKNLEGFSAAQRIKNKYR